MNLMNNHTRKYMHSSQVESVDVFSVLACSGVWQSLQMCCSGMGAGKMLI